MAEKNRFSKLLDKLLSEAEIKNHTLAQDLQYDVSYISKWLSGRALPAEKVEKKVLSEISHCIVTNASPEGLQEIMDEYNLQKPKLLEMAICDHLTAEYRYVRNQEKEESFNTSNNTYFYPELSVSQYLVKMHHPVLRRVKSLNIISLIDLMSMHHDSRVQFVGMGSNLLEEAWNFPDVHFSIIIHIDEQRWDPIYDTLFLIDLLANSLHINFQMYSSPKAYGRAVFAVKNDFMISGMLDDGTHCTSVVVSENANDCDSIYRNLSAMIKQDMLMFKKITVDEVISRHDYAHALLSSNLREIVGYVMERFLPDSIYNALLEQLARNPQYGESQLKKLKNLNQLNQSVLESSNVRIMIYESVFSSLVISNEIDFYGQKLKLSPKQKIELLYHFMELFTERKNLHVKLIHKRFTSNVRYITNQCVFLSDKCSYLRLNNNNGPNCSMMVDRNDVQNILDQFFETLWTNNTDMLLDDPASIKEVLYHVIHVLERMK